MLLNNQALLNTPKNVQARHARQLSDAIVMTLQIPDGSGLIPYLAPGQAQSNREAVRIWLVDHVDLETTITPTIVESSSQRLASHLNNVIDMTLQEF